MKIKDCIVNSNSFVEVIVMKLDNNQSDDDAIKMAIKLLNE